MATSTEPLLIRPDMGGPVVVGRGLLARLGEWVPETASGTFLVADATVFRLYGAAARHGLAGRPLLGAALVPPGEQNKTRAVKRAVEDRILDANLDRGGVVVGLGGGVTTDLAGFVAATYLRGVAFLAVPTSLVGMVDAALGGKTGVDTPHGKNLVGAFHPAVAVVADVETLQTLPEENLRDGFAEMLKHGAALDRAYFESLVGNAHALQALDLDLLTEAVFRSARIKTEVVDRDPREAGLRRVLNFGHTVGHGLEKVCGWRLGHGRAVGAGMWAEARCAVQMGLLDQADAEAIEAGLVRFGLRTFPDVDVDQVLSAMAWDKKNRAHRIRMALPEALGRMHPAGGQWAVEVEPSLVREVLSSVRREAATRRAAAPRE